MTIVNAYICPTCKDVIFSRARHDFHWCSCHEIAIDGGFDYNKVSYMKKPPRPIRISITATKEELYDDWNKEFDKFGIIKEKTKGMFQVIEGTEIPIAVEKNEKERTKRFIISYKVDKDEWFAIPIMYSTLSELINDFTGISRLHFFDFSHKNFEFEFCDLSFDARDFYEYDKETGEVIKSLPKFQTLNDWISDRKFIHYYTYLSLKEKH